MKKTTIERLIQQLIEQIEDHPHKDEIVLLATEQLMDDADLTSLT